MSMQLTKNTWLPISITGGLMIIFGIVLYRNAWLGDDAFITFRTVDNLLSGYGPVWNIAERVQSFTHPLWMMTLTLFSGITGEIYFTSIFLSMIISITAVGLFAYRAASTVLAAIIGVAIIVTSKAFIDYSTSGLENPMTHLLLVVFFIAYIRAIDNKSGLFLPSLIAAFGAVNRLDTILLFGPALLYLFFRRPSRKAIADMLIGFSPLLIWEAFSLFYYGRPFPNTAYAKINTGLSSQALMDQGLVYLRNAAVHGPVTALAILGAVFAGFRSKAGRLIPFSFAIVLYLVYIVKVGGDFMTGRFISAPFLISILILSQFEVLKHTWLRWSAVAAVLILGLMWPGCPVFSGAEFGLGKEATEWDRGISDERAGGFQQNGLLNVSFESAQPSNAWAVEGRAAGQSGESPVYRCGIGFYGYCAGPEVHILDCHALSDPLLASLPVTTKYGWRIGHFRRTIPEGYWETLETGTNMINDPDLKKYYEKLKLIHRGDLFNIERLREIVRLNFGTYDHLIQSYVNRPIQVSHSDIATPVTRGANFNSPQCHLVSESGLKVSYPDLQFNAGLELSVDHNDHYRVYYMLDTAIADSQDVKPFWIEGGGMRVDNLSVPMKVRVGGFDNLVIKPVDGDGGYSIGHVRLLDTSDDFRYQETSHIYDDSIELKSVSSKLMHGQLEITFEFKALQDIHTNYTIQFHVLAEGAERMKNYDFLPFRRTHSWKAGETIMCRRTIENPSADFKYALGFFKGSTRLGTAYGGTYVDTPSPHP